MLRRQHFRILEQKSLNPIQGINKYLYGIWKVLFKKSWIFPEPGEWFKITAVLYYIDDMVYTVVRIKAPDT